MSTPKDWNDREAWNRHFANRIELEKSPCDGFGTLLIYFGLARWVVR